jgi:2-keto-4-pentenoate hydratase
VLINDERVDHAIGSEETGHPVGAVAWLANKLAGFGRSLEPGHRIMSDSFTRQYPIGRGDRIETRFTPFGVVRAAFD